MSNCTHTPEDHERAIINEGLCPLCLQADLAEANKQIERLTQWKKQVPDKSGHWLRVNARGAVVYHKIFEDYFGKLSIYWGWAPKNRCIVKDIAHKLKQFCWLGPLLEPPEQALGGKNSKNPCTKRIKRSII